MPEQPPKRDVRQPNPDEGFERPPQRIEVPDERVEEPVDESVEEPAPVSDPPSFAPSEYGPPSKPDLPSTGLPSDAPGG